MESLKQTADADERQGGNRYGTHLFSEPWRRRHALLLPASVPGPHKQAHKLYEITKEPPFWATIFNQP
jgi:hypothetical protein